LEISTKLQNSNGLELTIEFIEMKLKNKTVANMEYIKSTGPASTSARLLTQLHNTLQTWRRPVMANNFSGDSLSVD